MIPALCELVGFLLVYFGQGEGGISVPRVKDHSRASLRWKRRVLTTGPPASPNRRRVFKPRVCPEGLIYIIIYSVCPVSV